MAEEKQVREFKQNEEARSGTTGLIFQGRWYPDEATLDASLDDKQKELRKGRGRGRMPAGAGTLGGTLVKDPNKLPGRSGSGVEQTEDIVTPTGQVVVGGGSGAGASADDLSKLKKDELQEIAAAKGVEVKGKDGKDPTKQDYVDALSGK